MRFTTAQRIWTLIVLLALIWLTALLSGGAPWDQALYGLLYAGDRPALASIALVVTDLGRWFVLVPVAVAAAIALAFLRPIRAALLLIIVSGGRLLIELQKLMADRPRPHISRHLAEVHSMSFPSSHAGNSMITFLAIALLLPLGAAWRTTAVAIALLLTFLVGVSRVMLGVHWPTDVVGGWSFGLLWTMALMRLSIARSGGTTRA